MVKTLAWICHSRWSHSNRIATLSLLVFLTGCTSLPTGPETSPVPAPESTADAPSDAILWEQRLERLEAWTQWRARGKVAYQLPENSGSASLHWTQDKDISTLRLSGPLGAGSTRIKNDGPLLRVRRDGIERLYPADAAPWLPGEKLLPVPIEAIQHWLKGVPAPSKTIDKLEHGSGVAKTLWQQGWQIEFLKYRDVEGIQMPSHMRLRTPDADLNLTLILRSWETTSEE